MSCNRYCLPVVLIAVLVFGTGCDWLFGTDDAPPSCAIASPSDSAIVSGVVMFKAEASDSFGVTRVEFYIDGALFGVDSEPSYAVSWDTDALEDRTWHRLHCIAWDPSDNVGYSDTADVEVRAGAQDNIYHGTVVVVPGYYRDVDFDAVAGDTVNGDVLVQGGGPISRFLLLDSDNYSEFRYGRAYQAIREEQNASQVTVHEGLGADDEYHIVLANDGTDTLTCWARFTLE